jgi:hypothetical protein
MGIDKSRRHEIAGKRLRPIHPVKGEAAINHPDIDGVGTLWQ